MFTSETSALSAVLADFQTGVGFAGRDLAAGILAAAMSRLAAGRKLEGPPKTPVAAERAGSLRQLGLAELGPCLSAAEAAEARIYFEGRPCYASHVPAQSDGRLRSLAETRALCPHASYGTEDVLSAPHLLAFANSDAVLATAESYLGCPPTIYSVNAFWSFPGAHAPTHGLQTFHRDFDDFRFCTLFVYLTDVGPDDGAHTFLTETHRPDVFVALLNRIAQESRDPNLRQRVASLDIAQMFAPKNLNLDAQCDGVLAPASRCIHGAAGHGLLEDTYGLHRGSVPKTPRLMFWARYGLYQNVVTFTDRLSPSMSPSIADRIPSTPYHRFVNRLLIDGLDER